MSVARIRTRGVVIGTAELFTPSATLAEAKQLVRTMNERARWERAHREAARRALLERTQLRPAAARARIDSREIYRERNRPRAGRGPQQRPASMPRRSRSFGQLAQEIYDAPLGDAPLIPTGRRGGAR